MSAPPPPPFNPGPPPPPGPYGAGPPPAFPPPGGKPPKGSSTVGIVILVCMGVLVLIAVGVFGVVMVTDDDEDPDLAGSDLRVPTPTASTPADDVTTDPTPTSTGPTEVELDSDFFSRSVETSRGTYRQSSNWTRSCTGEAKPELKSLLRRYPCTDSLQGAMYQSPNKKVYVQMTAMKFESQEAAERVSKAVDEDVTPRIRVSYGNEPGHWWSSSWAGKHVLIRQSFVNEANEPGPRSGPAQTYGDTLIRKHHAILKNLYVIGN